MEEEGRAIVVVLEAEGDVSRKQGVVQDCQGLCILRIHTHSLSVSGRRWGWGEEGGVTMRHLCTTVEAE